MSQPRLLVRTAQVIALAMVMALAGCSGAQSRKLLAKHYANKYGVRKG